MAALPKRKAKPMLTLIPESDTPINFRFNCAIVGDPAKEFAHLAVESEMAEAYRPKGAHKKTDVKPISEDEEHEDHHEAHHEKDDQLVVFCPTGMGAKELARLRLSPVVGFSDSLPLSKDRAIASNLVVCFLVWHVGKKDGSESVSSCVGDFSGRMAEIIHTPAGCRPLVTLLGFELNEAQEKELNAFCERQKAVSIIPMYFPDDSEDTVMDCLQSVCEAMIKNQTCGVRLSETGNVVTAPPDGKKSGCCTIS